MGGQNGDMPSNSDCLIYNDYSTGSSRRVIKHILRDIWWSEKKGINVIAMGTQDANSVEVLLTEREGYKTPQEWDLLTINDVLSQQYYTLKESDRMIHGDLPDAPNTFASTTAVDQFFGTQIAHMVMSVDPHRLPNRKIHHFTVGCK